MLILVASAAGLAVLAGGLWAGLRPRPTASEPPAQAALRQLDELARVPAQGPVLSRISRTVREYVTSAFNLPREEATTKEFVGRLQAEPSLGQQLIAQLPEFLRACDERKFSPNPPLGDFDAVGKARALIAAGEKQRAQLAAEKSAEAKPPTA